MSYLFSFRCVIAELFTEGNAPFDLSQLLAYCSGAYSPDAVLEQIEDEDIKVKKEKKDNTVKPALVTTCLQRPPVYNKHIFFPLKMVSHWNMY